MYFLSKVDIYLKHFISTGTKFFHETFWITKPVHKRCTKSAQKKAWSKIRTWDPGPGTLRPGTQDPETLRPGLWNPRLWDSGTPTPRNLEIGPWDLEIATLRPRILRAGAWELNFWLRFQVSWPVPQTELNLIVKQVLIIKS